MDSLYSIVLGVIQGIAEFLPISSSAHLIVVSAWMNDGQPLTLAQNIGLHLGTLFSVVVYFYRDWLNILYALKDRIFKGSSSHDANVLLPALIIGCIPAGIVGILAQSWIEREFHHPLFVVAPLVVVGFFMWWGDKSCPQERGLSQLNIKDAIIIGLFQVVALIPGASRSGVTILGGQLLKLDRNASARFSFLLGTPVMAGAALLNLDELAHVAAHGDFYLGMITALVTGLVSIRFLLAMFRKYGLLGFFFYRTLLALVVLVTFWPN